MHPLVADYIVAMRAVFGIGTFARWRDPAKLRRTIYATAAVAIVVEFVWAVFVRHGDFAVHRSFGRDFLSGNPYASAGNLYLLPRAMFDVVPAVLDYHLARVLFYIASVVALGFCIREWLHWATARFPLDRDKAFFAASLSVTICLAFIVRDFDECGLQILLLLFLTLAAADFLASRKIRCGFWLATAICYKATPLLFLPFLLWKREWKTCYAMAGWLVVLNMLPAVSLGWSGMTAAHVKWAEHMLNVSVTAEAYPSTGPVEKPKVQNLSLRAAVARYVETFPPGHRLHLDHPLFFQFGTLKPEIAKPFVWGVVFVLGACIAWRFRRPWRCEKDVGDFASEWAITMLFCALLSPVTWQQHLVLGLPCILLAVHSTIAAPVRMRWRMVAIVTIAIVLLIKRFTIGKELSLVLLSYKFDTFAFLAAALLVMFPQRLENRNS